MKKLTAAMVVLLAVPAFAAKEKRLDTPAKPIVIRPAEKLVTIDYKDAQAKVILKDMQKQCGIKNLVLDPGVDAKGTFLLTDVPCKEAFSVVLRTMGLDAKIYSSNIVNVGARKP